MKIKKLALGTLVPLTISLSLVSGMCTAIDSKGIGLNGNGGSQSYSYKTINDSNRNISKFLAEDTSGFNSKFKELFYYSETDPLFSKYEEKWNNDITTLSSDVTVAKDKNRDLFTLHVETSGESLTIGVEYEYDFAIAIKSWKNQMFIFKNKLKYEIMIAPALKPRTQADDDRSPDTFYFDEEVTSAEHILKLNTLFDEIFV